MNEPLLSSHVNDIIFILHLLFVFDIIIDHVTSYDHQVYSKGNKRLVVKADKATGLAAADSGKTSNPYVIT